MGKRWSGSNARCSSLRGLAQAASVSASPATPRVNDVMRICCLFLRNQIAERGRIRLRRRFGVAAGNRIELTFKCGFDIGGGSKTVIRSNQLLFRSRIDE